MHNKPPQTQRAEISVTKRFMVAAQRMMGYIFPPIDKLVPPPDSESHRDKRIDLGPPSNVYELFPKK